MTRSFETKHAVRKQVPLLIGLCGPSGSGKTFSALRLATGIRKVVGGKIHVIDTEAHRALHYAERFDFEHTPFDPPFSPADYTDVIEHCVRQGAKIIVVDSGSHEHESIGGVLEMHQKEVERLSKGDAAKAERVKMLAWSKPKQERRRMINRILQIPVHFLFCFRAKEKLKIVPGREPESLGWMPIAGDEFIYEMTVHALLYPNSGGVPTWKTDQMGEKAMMKLPEQFLEVFRERQPLSEDIGEKLATWAAGGAVNRYQELCSAIRMATNQAALDLVIPQMEEVKNARTVSGPEYKSLRAAWGARRDEIAKQPPASEYEESDPVTGELPMREPGDD